jgi:hypothetical protein
MIKLKRFLPGEQRILREYPLRIDPKEFVRYVAWEPRGFEIILAARHTNCSSSFECKWKRKFSAHEKGTMVRKHTTAGTFCCTR